MFLAEEILFLNVNNSWIEENVVKVKFSNITLEASVMDRGKETIVKKKKKKKNGYLHMLFISKIIEKVRNRCYFMPMAPSQGDKKKKKSLKEEKENVKRKESHIYLKSRVVVVSVATMSIVAV